MFINTIKMASKSNKFSWRVFISIALVYTFIIIFLTGIVLYFAPAGRVSNWVNWKFLGITKEQWQAIHTNFSFLFAILSIFHLFVINWRTFWTYLKSKTSIGLNKKREFLISTIATIFIIFGVMFSVPPFSSVMSFGEFLKESWDEENISAPIPHAELLTLNELANQLDSIPVEKIVKKLEANNIKFTNTTQNLSEIGALNGMSPAEIYELITKKSIYNTTSVGIGKKSLEAVAKENNLDLEVVLKILEENQIQATKDQTLKEIGEKYNKAPKDIFELFDPK